MRNLTVENGAMEGPEWQTAAVQDQFRTRGQA